MVYFCIDNYYYREEGLKLSKLTNRLADKLCSTLEESKLMTLTKNVLSSTVHDDSVTYTLLIRILSQVIKANSNKNLYMELISLILSATKKFRIKVKKTKNLHQYLHISNKKRVICSHIFEESIDCLIQSGKDQKLLLSMLAAVWQIRSVNPVLVQKLLIGLRSMPEFSEFSAALLSMPISGIFQLFGEDKSEEAAILKHMHLHATDHLLGEFKRNLSRET